jgi:hypothetical protein
VNQQLRRNAEIMQLTVYGDFNSALSYLASSRVDAIVEQQLAAVEWRGVEHDPTVPAGGRRVDSNLRAAMEADVAEIRSRLGPGESLPLRIPPFVSNTAAATAAYAGAPVEVADDVRRRLFREVWVEGRNISGPDVVEAVTRFTVSALPEQGRRWRESWRGLERAAVPMLILHTGYVARGTVAVACLGRLAFTGSLPYRPWAEFRSAVLDRGASRSAPGSRGGASRSRRTATGHPPPR